MVIPPDLLISAYCEGIFPMADDQGHILWYDPDPRAILPLNEFHVSRSLQKIIRQERFDVRFDSAFSSVIRSCAEPSQGRESTWIDSDIIDSYVWLHNLGAAHSVETWSDGELVGGLYGVAINGLFAGESMFSKMRDASKVALYHLVRHLRRQEFLLLDVQFITEHLKKFGAVEISRKEYRQMLAKAITSPSKFNTFNGFVG